MAICSGLGAPGRCHGYSVMQQIIRLVGNEYLAFWSWLILHLFKNM